LETRSYNQALKADVSRPFDRDGTVMICLYQFARSQAVDVQTTPWDLVMVDEAHRLRHVYKPTGVIANTLRSGHVLR
jgi:adenine-specific DNA-methyltransferase